VGIFIFPIGKGGIKGVVYMKDTEQTECRLEDLKHHIGSLKINQKNISKPVFGVSIPSPLMGEG
jgi:hypothetical protein